MQLMQHPQLKWGGESVWPPQLAPSYTEGMARCDLEGGVLIEVKYFPASPPQAPCLLLEVECHGKVWPGMVKLDDANYLQPFFGWLQKQLGKTIREIGQSDINF